MLRIWLIAAAAGAALLTAVVVLPPLVSPGTPVYLHRELPAGVAADLAARGCNIVRGHGVVSGPFTAPDGGDWAVLCQKGDQASLLIYTAGRGTPAVMATHGGGLEENPEAARGIRSVEWQYVARHNPGARIGGVPSACVEDGVGMASTLYCFFDGKWTGLTGAD